MRRVGARIVALVAIGALITVAVAAASMVFVPLHALTVTHTGNDFFPPPPSEYFDWTTTERRGVATARLYSHWDGQRAKPPGTVLPPDGALAPRVDGWAHLLDARMHASPDRNREGVAEARGWPFLAFSGTFIAEFRPGEVVATQTHGAILLATKPTSPLPKFASTRDRFPAGVLTPWRIDEHVGLIPFKPHLPGFLANTAIYGAAVGLLWFGPAAIQRATRRRRGACETCGHILAGALRCPECGAIPTVPSHDSRTSRRVGAGLVPAHERGLCRAFCTVHRSLPPRRADRTNEAS